MATQVASAIEAPEEKSWLVFADGSRLSDALILRLRETGVRCRVARAGDNFELDGTDTFTLRPKTLEDWQKLVGACEEKTPERIVYLWNLDARIDDGTMSTNLEALLHLAQALETEQPASNLRLDLVTRGAQPVGSDLQPNAIGQAPAIGLMRVISNEHSKVFCRGIDAKLKEKYDGSSIRFPAEAMSVSRVLPGADAVGAGPQRRPG